MPRCHQLAQRKVLYLHDRRRPDTQACGAVLAGLPGLTVHAPLWEDDPLGATRFESLVSRADQWLEPCALGLGLGFGAWLLLNAAAHRAARGSSHPRLLLVDVPWRAGRLLPRQQAIAAALGLGEAPCSLSTKRVHFLVSSPGGGDTSPIWAALSERAFPVERCPGELGWRDDQAGAALLAYCARLIDETRAMMA